MQKKIIILLISVVMFCTNICLGYSTDQYNITMPSSYSLMSDNAFMNTNGNSISISVMQTEPPRGFKYTEKYLNMISDEILSTETENLKNVLKESIEQVENEYGISLSDDEITKIVDSFKINLEDQEITTFTKNNYECFYFKYKGELNNVFIYGEQYVVVSNDYTYVVSIASQDKDYFDSTELKGIINSLSFTNYKEIETIWDKVIATFISALICSIIYWIFQKITGEDNKNNDGNINKKNNKSKTLESDEKLNTLIQSIENEQEQQENEDIGNNLRKQAINVVENTPNYCDNCGSKLFKDDRFCANCGKKIVRGGI